MLLLPAVLNVVVSVAVSAGGAPVVGLKPTEVIVGVPAMAVPLAVTATVPVGPATLRVGASNIRVRATAVAVVTPDDGLAVNETSCVGTAATATDRVLEVGCAL